MRFDATKDTDFMQSDQWLLKGPPELFEKQPGSKDKEGKIQSNSLSGLERNRLKFQRDGNFKEVSLVSGADFKQDGRGFVLFDYDNDGWLDIGLVSSNAPRFRILRNQIGDLLGSNSQPKKRVSVELIGGNTQNGPAIDLSPRDGYGAKITVTSDGKTRAFSYACSEGLSVQNSRRLHIGMGQDAIIDELKVYWPSGKTSSVKNVQAGESITIREIKAD